MVGMMDGSVTNLSESIEPQQLLFLVQHQDGNVVNLPFDTAKSASSVPGIIIRSAVPIDTKTLFSNFEVAEESQSVDMDGFEAAKILNGAFMHFPNPLTLLVGSEESIRQMIATREKSGDVKVKFESLYPTNNAAAAMDLASLNDDIQEILGAPFGPILKTLVSANLVLDATGDNESLLSIEIETDSKKSAQQFAGIVSGGYLMLKAQLMAGASAIQPELSDAAVEKLSEIVDSVTIEADEETVSLDLPRIEEPAEMVKDLTPFMNDFFDGFRESLNRSKESALRNPIRAWAWRCITIMMLSRDFHPGTLIEVTMPTRG